jgi:hypothetical protein
MHPLAHHNVQLTMRPGVTRSALSDTEVVDSWVLAGASLERTAVPGGSLLIVMQ